MKQKRYTEEQIIGILNEAEAGIPVGELCRKHGMSDVSFYNWRSRYGGMTVSEAKRLKQLEEDDVYGCTNIAGSLRRSAVLGFSVLVPRIVSGSL